MSATSATPRFFADDYDAISLTLSPSDRLFIHYADDSMPERAPRCHTPIFEFIFADADTKGRRRAIFIDARRAAPLRHFFTLFYSFFIISSFHIVYHHYYAIVIIFIFSYINTVLSCCHFERLYFITPRSIFIRLRHAICIFFIIQLMSIHLYIILSLLFSLLRLS